MKKLCVLLILAMSSSFLLSTCRKEEYKVELPAIYTLAVTEITDTTAKSGGNITYDGGGEITSKGVVWSTSQDPTFEQHTGLTVEGAGAGLFYSVLTGIAKNKTYYVRAYATNSAGTVYGNAISFNTLEGITGSTFTDSRDGKIYQTVTIGNQKWMAENLAYVPSSGNYWAYDNDHSNVESYGYLYDWETALDVCPPGWHLPSDSAWTQLIIYIVIQGHQNNWGNPNGAGNALKSCRQVNSPWGGDCKTTVHPRWVSDVIHHGIDKFGFSALPGGYLNAFGIVDSFSSLGNLGIWWSSTESPLALSSWYRCIYSGYGDVDRNYDGKGNGFSVRCLRD